MDNIKERTLEMHREHRGKLEVVPKVEICDTDSLSLAYTPGVAEPCREIAKNPDDVYTYTTKGNMVAIVTDGTAVLGLGDIGPAAALPVMEGKASTPPKVLNRHAVPSITGSAAAGPMSPRPRTAVPSVTMATILPLVV